MSSKIRVPERTLEQTMRLLKLYHVTFSMWGKRVLAIEDDATKRNAKRKTLRITLEDIQQTAREIGECLGMTKPALLDMLAALTCDPVYLGVVMDEKVPEPADDKMEKGADT